MRLADNLGYILIQRSVLVGRGLQELALSNAPPQSNARRPDGLYLPRDRLKPEHRAESRKSSLLLLEANDDSSEQRCQANMEQKCMSTIPLPASASSHLNFVLTTR